MDGFKNTTKTSYDTASGRKFANGGMTVSRADMPNGEGPMSKPAMVAKYAKGGSVKKGEQKIGRVMREFTEGKLHSGSKEGPKVKSTKQAVAIALNEARAAGAKIPRVKKAMGGYAEGGSPEADDVLMARMTKDELAMGAKGVRMARERMAKDRVNMPAKKPLPKKAVPPVSERPLIGGVMGTAAKGIQAAGKNPAGILGVRTRDNPAGVRGVYGAGALTDREMETIKNALGYKKGGGLSVMPKGKGKGC